MPSFYDGKVPCPECNDGKIIVERPEYEHSYEEQCWTCGASGWVSKEFFEQFKVAEVSHEDSQG